MAYTSFFMLKADFDQIIDSAEVMEGAINGINGDKRNINKTIQNVKVNSVLFAQALKQWYFLNNN